MTDGLADLPTGALAQLRADEAFFRAIFDTAAVGLTLVDAQGHIVLINDAQARLWGYVRAEVLGEAWLRFILPDDHFIDSDLLQALWERQRSSYTVEKRCVRKDESVMWGRFTVSLVRDLSGQVFYTLLVCEDVTERKRREQIDYEERLERHSEDLERRVAERTWELSEAYEQLRRLNQLKDEFVGRLSHDLHAPMATIKLYAGLLKKGRPEKHAEYLQVLSQQVARLEKILDDLTAMSHLDRGKTEFYFAKSDLNEVVVSLQDKWAAVALARHLTLSFDLAPNLPPIMVDSSLLQKAAAHLLKNALDYSAPESHIICRTGLLQQDTRSWVTLSITNSGLGLSAEELQHVGERFYRGRAARHYKIDGTGLGLALCQEIITRHGGRLVASSEPDVNATFSIWLEPAATLALEARAPVGAPTDA